MHNTTRSLSILASAACLTLIGCDPAPSGQGSTMVVETNDAVEMVDTYDMKATVTQIDAATRTLSLRTPEGHGFHVKAGPAVVNFAYIKVGDQVTATVTEELAVVLTPGGDEPSAGVASTVALAPVGAPPAAYVADAAEVTARVAGIDPRSRKIRLAFVDGTTRMFRVGKKIDLANLHVGDDITVLVAESLAVEVH